MVPVCFTLEGLLSQHQCLDFVKEAESDGYLQMNRDYPPSYRDNDRIVLDSQSLATTLYSRLKPHLPETWKALDTVWELVGLNSRFRGCRYRDGQKFVRHRDGAHSEPGGERSFLTVMLYLNDGADFEGGATRFYRDRYVTEVERLVVPQVGTGIIFDHSYWHDGEAVTRGTKYVLRTDVMYRPRGEHRGEGHAGYVWDIVELACGRLASGSRDRTIRVWGAGGRTEQILTHHTGSVTRLLSRDQGFWSGGRDRTLAIWEPDSEGFRLRHSFLGHQGAVLAMASLFDGTVATTGADNFLSLWSPAGERLAQFETGVWPWCLHQASDGRLLVGCDDGTVQVLTPGGRGLQRFQECPSGVVSLLELEEGTLLAGCADGKIRRWQRFGRPLSAWCGHRGPVTTLARGPRGELLSGSEDDGVRLWREGSSKELLRHRDFVRSLCVTRQGVLVSGSYDGSVRRVSLPSVTGTESGPASNPATIRRTERAANPGGAISGAAAAS